MQEQGVNFAGIVNIKRNKTFSLINIFGLAFGFAFSIIAGFYVYREYSFDKFNKNAGNIYRLLLTSEDKNYRVPIFPATFLPEIQEKLPGLDNSVRVQYYTDNVTLFFNNEVHAISNVIFTDPQYFNLFSFPIIQGNPKSLKDPTGIFVSENFANKYFSNQDPVGQTILFENKFEFIIRGVFNNLPGNSIFQTDVIGSFESLRTINPYQFNSWNARGTQIYFFLPKLKDPKELIHKLIAVVDNIKPESAGDNYFDLQPFLDIHLYSSDIQWDWVNKSDVKSVTGVLLFAIFILLISIINYILLLTANLNDRLAKLRLIKIIGANTLQLIFQHAFEIFINVLISILISIIIIEISLPLVSNLIRLSLSTHHFLSFPFLLFYITGYVIVSFVILVFSIIPIYNISLNKNVIPGKLKYRLIGSNISLQYAFTIVMITSSYFMYKQIRLLTSENLGFNKSQLIMIDNPYSDDMGKRYAEFKTQAEKLSGVQNIAGANNAPLDNINNGGTFYIIPDKEKKYYAGRVRVSDNFFSAIGCIIIKGKNFSGNIEADKNNIIINETVYNELADTEIIGKQLVYEYIRSEPYTIIGVSKDIQHEKLINVFEPAVYYPPEDNNDEGLYRIIIRLTSGNPEATIKKLGSIWNKLAPNWPFQYTFMDERIDRIYNVEISSLHFLSLLTVISLFLSCMGIFSLSWHMISKKRKEIGIRKVNGANSINIFVILNEDYLKWILPGFLIAVPIAWYVIEKWLQNYAYKISIHWLVFAAAGLITMFIVLISISLQTIKASYANPIDALRYE